MTRNMMILYITISVLSLVWIILSYYGYVRYLKLNIFSCEHFAKSYLKLPKANSTSKIIVSLSTSFNNLKNIKPTINSLLDQTVHPDQIILSVDNIESQSIIPIYLTGNNIIIVHKLSKAYGKCVNFISPLLRERDANTKIILVDDGQVYGIDFLETIIDASNENPNKAIYVKGYNAKKFVNENKFEGPDNVIDIHHGVLISPSFFSNDVIETLHTPLSAPNAVLSAHLIKNKVSIHKINYKENFINKFTSREIENEKMGIIFYAVYFDI